MGPWGGGMSGGSRIIGGRSRVGWSGGLELAGRLLET